VSGDRFFIDAALVRRLVSAQFPQWARLPVLPVEPGGWDHRSFRLGEQWLVRLPSARGYAAQVDKEQRFLPVLAPQLPLPIPVPVAQGVPALGYPCKWSVYRWIEGDTVTRDNGAGLQALALDLARFLQSLQSIDATGGPAPGEHNFFRGAALSVYDGQVHEALHRLGSRIDTTAAAEVWQAALASTWQRAPVWVHGDVSQGNLLQRDGHLCAVIDFGNCCVGDPACDLVVAWTLFDGNSHASFRAALALDEATWARARGWALWKALVVAGGLAPTSALEWAQPLRLINDLLR
jgi:aminoglycoside phosphotransferase (APT) family kinase protein